MRQGAPEDALPRYHHRPWSLADLHLEFLFDFHCAELHLKLKHSGSNRLVQIGIS